MADNVPITAGSGTSIATDQIGSDHYQKMKLFDGTADSTNAMVVDATGAASVAPNSVVSTANSSTSNLAGAAVFTGTSEDVSNFAEIRVMVYSSHASATDGLSLQQSTDGTNWFQTDVYTVAATTAKVLGIGVAAKYFRLVYTNGATLTTTLQIQTIFKRVRTKPSSQRPMDARINDIDVEEVAAYGMLYNGTTWDRAQGSGGSAYVLNNGGVVTGSLSSTASVTMDVRSFNQVAVYKSGTFTGTLIVEASIDGTTFFTWNDMANGSALSQFASSNANVQSGNGIFDVSPVTTFRVRCTAYTSGTVNLTIQPSTAKPTYWSAANLGQTVLIGGTVVGTIGGNGTSGSSVTRVTIASDSTGQIQPAATTSATQACTPFIANAVGTATNIKSSAGNLFGMSLLNNNAATVFVEFFDAASVTLGTTAVKSVFVIPASGTLTVPPDALAFSNHATQIFIAAVTAYNGSTTGSVTGTVFYK